MAPIALFEFWPLDGQEVVSFVDRRDVAKLRALDGTPVGSAWNPIRFRVINSHSSRELGRAVMLEYSDAPHALSSQPVFRETAYRVLLPLLIRDGEFLPVECDEGPLWLYNCTRVVDALDVEATKGQWFDYPTRLMNVTKYAFQEDRLGEADAFRIPQWLKSTVFVRESVASAIRDAGLKRIGLRQVWTNADSIHDVRQDKQ